MTDPELMACAAKGDEQAFGAIVERHKDALLNFFVRQNISHSDGQDLAQRTFLRIWRYRSRYSPKAKFTTFLFMIARQESIDFFRSEARRREAMDGVAQECEIQASERQGQTESGADDGLLRAFRSLPDAMRSVVELVVMQNLPQAEAAEILGIPLGTVKSRLFHALRRLKEELPSRG